MSLARKLVIASWTWLASCADPTVDVPDEGTTGTSTGTGVEDGRPDDSSGTSMGPESTTTVGSSGSESTTTVGSSGSESTTVGVSGPESTTTGSSSESESTTTGSSSGPDASCGNGIVEPGELCDDAGESAACNVDCTPVACGDGILNVTAGEECDDVELGSGTCQSLGFDVGTLACSGGCSYDTSDCWLLPGVPLLELGFSPVKQFDFSWAAVAGAEYYQLLESAALGEPFVQLGGDIVGESISISMPLYFRFEASYVLRACNGGGCTDSATVDVMGSLAGAVGYFKASNTGTNDVFGERVVLSGDGNTLAVGASGEGSSAIGIDGDQANDLASSSGAVYVFARDGLGTWPQQAYVKASNTGANDDFGHDVALSDDGNTLAVSAHREDSNATGIGGDQANDLANNSGAVYVFVRDGLGTWSQQAYVKASNTGSSDELGDSVALSGDGNTLAVGAGEDSSATGIGGNQVDNSATNSGAVYVFVRDGLGTWSQQAYVKASNTGAGDSFGRSVALGSDGSTLAVGARGEDSNATGIGGNQANNAASNSGAVYVFVRSGMGVWSQQAYVKASNTGTEDELGGSVALSDDGNTLVAGAIYEDSNAAGVGGDQANNGTLDAGAVYVFARDGAGTWSQQAYVKASNPGAGDAFGGSVAFSSDGNVLAVGAYLEASNAVGLEGDQANDTGGAGAIYVLVRDGAGSWAQQAYVKASNTGVGDRFGECVSLSADGNTLAAGARWEDGNATGIDGNQADDSLTFAGAAYLF